MFAPQTLTLASRSARAERTSVKFAGRYHMVLEDGTEYVDRNQRKSRLIVWYRTTSYSYLLGVLLCAPRRSSFSPAGRRQRSRQKLTLISLSPHLFVADLLTYLRTYIRTVRR